MKSHLIWPLRIILLFQIATASNSLVQAEEADAKALSWHTDYAEAMELAQQEKKMMFIHFHDPAATRQPDVFESGIVSDPAKWDKLSECVLTKLPADVQITVKGQPVKVLDHAAFEAMKRGPGLAMIDFTDEDTEHYGHVVSVFPFQRGKYYEFKAQYLPVILSLPKGTLTQRTMVFAVRIHPEQPKSTRGELDPVLLDEAKGSAAHQASIRVQGHHNWDTRFHRIVRRLLGRGPRASSSSTVVAARPVASTPVEVCAESWPNQDLMDSCVDCVASWRQSDGHWSAVKAEHAIYGYDIRRGSNGIWYATGIFAN